MITSLLQKRPTNIGLFFKRDLHSWGSHIFFEEKMGKQWQVSSRMITSLLQKRPTKIGLFPKETYSHRAPTYFVNNSNYCCCSQNMWEPHECRSLLEKSPMLVGLFCKSDVIIRELIGHCFPISPSKNMWEPYECGSLLKKSPMFVGLFCRSDVIIGELHAI